MSKETIDNMTNQIKNFIEEGEKEFRQLFCTSDGELIIYPVKQDYANDGMTKGIILTEGILDFISSRQISLIKMIVDEQMRDAEKAIKWAEDPYTKGYSESWKSGYLKAYEQVRNDLLKELTDGK